MKYATVICLLLMGGIPVAAQTDASIIGQSGSLTLMPVYQRWAMDGKELFSQAAATLSLYQPLGRAASISAQGSYASTHGNVTSLRGFSDVQLSGRYHLESANMVFGLAVNFPTGKTKLTTDEFETSLLISSPAFRTRVPQYGTGFDFAPSIMWAIPITDDLVLGVGAMYRYRGVFSPFADNVKFDPGDEASFSGGLDMRVGEASTISLDAVVTSYGRDKFEGLEVYSPGNKIFSALQYSTSFDQHEFMLQAIFRKRLDARLPVGGVFLLSSERSEPNQAEFRTSLRIHAADAFNLRIAAEARFLEETSAVVPLFTIYGIGLGPEFILSDNVSLPMQATYRWTPKRGGTSFEGMEGSVGIVVTY